MHDGGYFQKKKVTMEEYKHLTHVSLSDSALGLHIESDMGKLFVTGIEPGYPAHHSGQVWLKVVIFD
jgi:hypothetical protein